MCVLFQKFNHLGSKKQQTVFRSSIEVEFRCHANVATGLVWLASLFKEMKILLPKPQILWCDNLGAAHLSANPILHSITKHVELDIYFVRDLVLQPKITVQHLPVTAQVADILTKPLFAHSFIPLRVKLGVTHVADIGLRGDIKAAQ